MRFRWFALPSLLLAASIGGSPVLAQASPDLRAEAAPANALWVETLDLSKMTQGWQTPQAGHSVEGRPLTLKGTVFPHGIGTHARSEFVINLKRAATRFLAMVGVDDEKTGSDGSVVFEVWVDGKKIADSGVMRGGQEPKPILADLRGAKQLRLLVEDGGDGIDSDHADWAGALLVLDPKAKAKPQAVPAPMAKLPVVKPRMTVPTPDPKPAIHGARIVGGTPGRAFLFLISATGEGPLTYEAANLPDGLTLDPKTGILSGTIKQAGTTTVQLTARGPRGVAKRTLTIVGGDHQLALTPPMGWNSWNVWAGAVDAEKVRASADWMVKSGLAAHGFQYINIDDTWEAGRDSSGEIQTNSKFGDMKALSDYVHGLGLKLGIYSSPGPQTCGGFEASYQHEQQDADTYAKWGIDYLKYDWCSYGEIAKNDTSPELEKLQKPYRVMQDALDKCGRDIVYSLCQYGMGNVWEWGAQVGGNCWRTTGDITDTWQSLHDIYTSQDGHEKYAGPGHWNDPDMLIVGLVGWGNPHPSRLTPNEQLLHISMWCLLSSPLLIGCDMSRLDPFTVAILSNDEVLDINQDPLGKPAGRIAKDGQKEIWARPLADGTLAVGLINGDPQPQPMTVTWKDLTISGRQPIRDLWLHRNVGAQEDHYTVTVPAHGIVLIKVGKPNK